MIRTLPANHVAVGHSEIDGIGGFGRIRGSADEAFLDFALRRASVAVDEVSIVAFLAVARQRQAVAADGFTDAVKTVKDWIFCTCRAASVACI